MRRSLAQRIRIPVFAALAGALLPSACSDGKGPAGRPRALELLTADARQAVVASRLPVGVRVVDDEGEGIGGVRVEFAVRAGGGAVSPAAVLTDAAGEASATWTLGVTAGEQRLEARTPVAGVPALSTTSTALPGPAVRLEVTPVTIRLGALGSVAPLSAHATDAYGNAVPGGWPSWSTSDSTVATVTREGRVQAVGNGAVVVRAELGELAASAAVEVAQVPAVLFLTPATLTVGIGRTRRLEALVADSNGASIEDPIVQWASSAPDVARVDSLGVVEGLDRGGALVTAAAGALRFSATVTVEVASNDFDAAVDTLRPGQTVALSGPYPGWTHPGLTATVAGVPATVLERAPGSVRIRVPAAAALPCGPAGAVVLKVTWADTTRAALHPLRPATPRALAPGESAHLLAAEDVHCVELPATQGRYVVSVVNTSRTGAATAAFQLRGIGQGGASVAAGPAYHSAPASPFGPSFQEDAGHHARVLEASRALVRRSGPPAPVRSAPAGLAAAVRVTAPGDTLTLNIPVNGSCEGVRTVLARVVYAGTRALMLEDVAAPLAGQVDSLYVRAGQEFDTLTFDVLRQGFGDPLAMDARLDGNGRILMLFSKVVNDMGGVLGFVWAGDFYPRSAFPCSNQAEVFYGVVPTARGAITTPYTDAWWGWVLSAITTHEVKHITSFAERLSRGLVFEESWLEESTAQIAMELWARRHYGYGQRGNTGYDDSLYCEEHPTEAACAGKPWVMRHPFGYYRQYLTSSESSSPIHDPTADLSVYGSGWSLVRWALDHSSADERELLRALTSAPERGLDNLAARTGRGPDAMLADWALAGVLDDREGFTPGRAELTQPSWNLRDVLSRQLGSGGVYPLQPRALSFGSFILDVAQLKGGSSAIFELSGPQTSPQYLRLRGASGGPPPASLRMAIVRVQ